MPLDVPRGQALLDFATTRSPVVFYIAHAKTNWPTTFISENVERITGHKATTLLADPERIANLIHPDDRRGARPSLEQLRGDGCHTAEFRLATASGEYRWVRESAHLTNEDGHAQIVGCMVDITAAKDPPSSDNSDEIVRRVLEACPVPIRMTRLSDGEIFYESPSSTEAYGASPHEAPRMVTEHYADPSDRDHYVEQLRLHGHVDDYVVQLRRANGEHYPASVSSKLIEFGGEDVIVSTTIDLTAQRQRESELRRAQETLEDAIEALSEGFALYDEADRLIICNERYRDFHRKCADLLVPGVNWVDLMREEAQRGMYVEAIGREEDWVKDRVKARRNFQTGLEYEQTDGRWVEGANQYTRQGGVVVTLADITERKKREQQLREAREVLEDAIESLSEGFAIWDAEDRLMLCNSKYRDLNAICSDILVPGVTWEELIRTGAERGQFLNAVGRVEDFVADWKKNRNRASLGFETKHPDGRWFIGSSQRTRHGGMVGVRIDITERKEMEEALRESENLVRRVLEACPVPVTMNHVESGEILYESPAAKQLYTAGKSPDHPEVLRRWADISQRKNYLDALLSTGAIDGWEIERIRHDGSTFWALESARLIEFRGEQVIVSSVLDLTERREKDAEIARQREALHQSEKLSALGELLAGVSHELNNPLSVLVGQAQLLKETMTDPEISHRAEKISEAANRCARIVKSFLSMARQEPAESRPSNINDAVEAALEVTAYGLRSADIEVVLNLASDPPPVMLDPDQFGQVVVNLLVNAQHALEEHDHDRTLTVETRYSRHRGSVLLSVSDNGPGIPEDIQKRIFEPLYTTKEVGVGTGIGLALCHRIVATHGGFLKVESQPGEGATFVVGLPRSGADPVADEMRASAPLPSGTARILVIDDEPEVAAVLAEILQGDGHQIDIAHSGEEALRAIARSSYDIILSDLRMPHLDGQGLYKHLEKERPELRDRIGFLTGDTLSQRAREFLRGVDCPFIEKPATAEDVRELVSSFLDRM